MAEYIDRKSLIDEFDRLGLGEHSFVERVFSDGVRTIIAGIPAADVAPVVHCKDCAHRTEMGNCGHPRYHGILPSAYPYDFCSYGERKDGGEEDLVETVPVVRCENCLYWVYGKNECESWEWCKMLNTDMPPNGFCYLGDRKDEARNEL